MGEYSCGDFGLACAAKAGLRMSTRRLLAYHAKPGDKSILEYSWDAVAPVMDDLGLVRQAISAGIFDPTQHERAGGACRGLRG